MPPEAHLGGGTPGMMCRPGLQLHIQATRIQFCKWLHDTGGAVVFGIYLTATLVNRCHLHQISRFWYTMLCQVLEKFAKHKVIPPIQVFEQLRRQATWSTGFITLEDLERGADVFFH